MHAIRKSVATVFCYNFERVPALMPQLWFRHERISQSLRKKVNRYEDKDICDIVYVYKENHASMLVRKQLIPSTDFEHNEDEFKFEDSYEEEDKPVVKNNDPYMMLDIDDTEEFEPEEVEYDSYGNVLSWSKFS